MYPVSQGNLSRLTMHCTRYHWVHNIVFILCSGYFFTALELCLVTRNCLNPEKNYEVDIKNLREFYSKFMG